MAPPPSPLSGSVVFVTTAVALAASAVVDSVEAVVEAAVEEEVCVAAISADGSKLRYVSEGAETLKEEYISSRTELPISGNGFSASLRGNVHRLIFPPLTHSSLGRLSVGGAVGSFSGSDQPPPHASPSLQILGRRASLGDLVVFSGVALVPANSFHIGIAAVIPTGIGVPCAGTRGDTVKPDFWASVFCREFPLIQFD